MRLSIKTSPDIAETMRREVLAGEKATTRAMTKVGTDLKLAWRRQINGAGLGTRLANSVRSATYPKSGESLRVSRDGGHRFHLIVGSDFTGSWASISRDLWH